MPLYKCDFSHDLDKVKSLAVPVLLKRFVKFFFTSSFEKTILSSQGKGKYHRFKHVPRKSVYVQMTRLC